MWFPFSPKYPEFRPEDIHNQAFDYIVVGGMMDQTLCLLLVSL